MKIGNYEYRIPFLLVLQILAVLLQLHEIIAGVTVAILKAVMIPLTF